MSKLIILGIGGDSITGCQSNNTYPFQGLGKTGIGDCTHAVTQAPYQYLYGGGANPLIARVLAVSGTRLEAGNGSDDMTTVATAYFKPMVTPDGSAVGGGGIAPIPQRKYIYSLFPGSNNGCLSNVDNTVATFVSEVAAFGAMVKGWGAHRFMIGTVLPRADVSGPMTDSNRVAYNAAITAAGWAAANGVDGIFDFAADSIMGNIVNCSNTTWYNSDLIHPTAAGHARLAPIWMAALNSVIATL